MHGRQQQQQLSQQIVAAADEIARLAQGQANNATTSAGATQAGIYDLIDKISVRLLKAHRSAD
ncbi:hypothetical protein ACLB1N_05805 [Escherichia coli]